MDCINFTLDGFLKPNYVIHITRAVRPNVLKINLRHSSSVQASKANLARC